MRVLRIAFVCAATLLTACSDPYGDANIFTVVVVGSVNPVPLPFAGSYQYLVDGEAITRDLSSEGSFADTFEADELRYVRVVATSREGSYRLAVHRNGELIFDSAARPAAEPIVYSGESLLPTTP